MLCSLLCFILKDSLSPFIIHSHPTWFSSEVTVESYDLILALIVVCCEMYNTGFWNNQIHPGKTCDPHDFLNISSVFLIVYLLNFSVEFCMCWPAMLPTWKAFAPCSNILSCDRECPVFKSPKNILYSWVQKHQIRLGIWHSKCVQTQLDKASNGSGSKEVFMELVLQ